ncbi:MAG: hypothetical protein QOJ07_3651 [Thermoleophilaceae bacterium]|jgi:hypothetical protein|nr:hypothetical protein [Thermoleophilaceae bacterium]
MPRRRPAKEPESRWLKFVRYGVPALIFLAGTVITVVDPDKQRGLQVGSMFCGAAIAVLLLNVLFRIGVSGDVDRDREEDARRYFDEHGHWPDERPRA